MKIKTSIIINSEEADYIIEVSENNSDYTTIKERVQNEYEHIILTIPNKQLEEFAKAIQEHIKILGL
jgi:ADP-heptose:LPS heptosyltransferase